MGVISKVQWIDEMWNPVTGCTKISPGCENCFAERVSSLWKALGKSNYKNGFDLTLHRDAFELPFNWEKPSVSFVAPLSDVFHENVPIEFIQEIFGVIHRLPQHLFLTLTKRSQRLKKINSELSWPPNLLMGVSVESSDYVYRIDHLRDTNAHWKFVSFRPLLGSIKNPDLDGINAVVARREDGPKARKGNDLWRREIEDVCSEKRIPLFCKDPDFNLREIVGWDCP